MMGRHPEVDLGRQWRETLWAQLPVTWWIAILRCMEEGGETMTFLRPSSRSQGGGFQGGASSSRGR